MDQIKALERLAQLRKEGVLTDAEFEQQKAQLLAAGSSPSPDWSGAIADFQSRFPAALKRGLIFGVITVVLVIGAMLWTSRSSAVGWTISTTKDPLSDATVDAAATTIGGNLFDTEVVISCASTGAISYEFKTFLGNGDGAELRNGVSAFDGQPFVGVEARRDDKPSFSLSYMRPQFNNYVLLVAPPVDGPQFGTGPDELARGANVTIKLPGLNGDQTITFAQTDPGLRKLLDTCLQKRDAAAGAIEAQVEQSRRHDEAQRAADSAEMVMQSGPNGLDIFREPGEPDATIASVSTRYRNVPDDDAAIRRVPIIAKYEELNSACRDGSGDDTATRDICDKRDQLYHAVKVVGFCWGDGTEQSEAETRWHRCPTSAQ